MQFSLANKKLKELYEQVRQNSSDIDEKSSEEILLSFFKSNATPYFNLGETEWIAKRPDRNYNIFNPEGCTVTRSQLLPEALNIDFESDIELPPSFVPFLDVIAVVQPPKGAQISNYVRYLASRIFGNTVQIKVDGDQIYLGPAPYNSNGFLPTYSTDELDAYMVPSANRKPIWDVQFQYDAGAGAERYTGKLLLLHVKKSAGTGCDGALTSQWDACKFNIYREDVSGFPDSIAKVDKYAVITSLSLTSVTGQGDIYRVRSVSDGGGGCQISTSTSTENVAISTSLFENTAVSSTRLVIQGIKEKFISGNWVVQGNAEYDLNILGSWSPQFNTVSQTKYTVHYLPDWDGWIQLFEDNVQDIWYLQSGGLAPMPQSDGHVLEFLRNPDGYPTTTTELQYMFTQASVNGTTVGNKIGEGKEILYLQKINNAKNKYKLIYKSAVTILSPATELVSTETGQFKGDVDLFSNPNYPAANRGDWYRVGPHPMGIGGGKIGGPNGHLLQEGDIYYCLYDKTPAGTQAEVGQFWTYGTITTQDDTYTPLTYFDFFYNRNITTYINTATNTSRSRKFGDVYISENADAQYKLMLVLKNPLYTKEIRKYDTSQ